MLATIGIIAMHNVCTFNDGVIVL